MSEQQTAKHPNADQKEYWNGDAGQKWVAAQARLDKMLSGVTAALMAEAKPASGLKILDVGCGCGETSIALQQAGAQVTGVDISAPMLAHAKTRTTGIDFVHADASTHKFGTQFDLLFSRFGVMFFDNPDEAFRHMRTAIKPGGRAVFACWQDWRENEWVRVPVSAVRPFVPPQPQLGPEDPGPFSFADLARVRRILSTSGWDQITAKPLNIPLTMGADLDEAVQQVSEIGPASRMLTGASDDIRKQAAAAMRKALEPFASRKPLSLGGAIWIITAKN